MKVLIAGDAEYIGSTVASACSNAEICPMPFSRMSPGSDARLGVGAPPNGLALSLHPCL